MPDVRTHEPDDHDNAYAGLLVNDAHWAFGTDFEDPLAGVDTTVPDGVDPATLATYCLMLGDDALVLSQRLAEWCSNAPDLEEDIALSNIALDLLGQARLLLARAAAADGSQVPTLPDSSPVPDEDRLAFFRDAPQFRNVRLAEVPGGDFAQTVVRILLFSSWRLALLDRLNQSRDAVLAAVAAKAVKELTYHRDFAGRWFLTLARGTDESRRRLVAGLDALWPFWTELFETHDVERAAARSGVGVDPADVAADVEAVLDQVLAASGVERPAQPPHAADHGRDGRTGRDGEHTEALTALLAEMQVVARAHPGGQW
ncbi:1,2-phenylacetyl-CoA epoxidase subunit PaaC [Promicromonospora iranensis]|uniref:Ring-1,2-phenylacetyl-CoA epoxidase subunit PaaC n=1 Tax=Promicromonospora iranensis TaxID=1105144 RepID=A0ABU2CW61_9MICO|nr:1,2-phenylacetyl-CoA epoxidase subunit PaaC [Promicromonospora iranensis]MDR7385555.1 ring-1,2-phenylacetyl-CoA epoxidase subunit PaaC [Promicromonospora iranensis]